MTRLTVACSTSFCLQLKQFSSVVTCSSLPTSLVNGAVTGSKNSYTSTVTFTCSNGFFISGQPQTVVFRKLLCQLNGLWNDTTPTCSGASNHLWKRRWLVCCALFITFDLSDLFYGVFKPWILVCSRDTGGMISILQKRIETFRCTASSSVKSFWLMMMLCIEASLSVIVRSKSSLQCLYCKLN